MRRLLGKTRRKVLPVSLLLVLSLALAVFFGEGMVFDGIGAAQILQALEGRPYDFIYAFPGRIGANRWEVKKADGGTIPLDKVLEEIRRVPGVINTLSVYEPSCPGCVSGDPRLGLWFSRGPEPRLGDNLSSGYDLLPVQPLGILGLDFSTEELHLPPIDGFFSWQDGVPVRMAIVASPFVGVWGMRARPTFLAEDAILVPGAFARAFGLIVGDAIWVIRSCDVRLDPASGSPIRQICGYQRGTISGFVEGGTRGDPLALGWEGCYRPRQYGPFGEEPLPGECDFPQAFATIPTYPFDAGGFGGAIPIWINGSSTRALSQWYETFEGRSINETEPRVSIAIQFDRASLRASLDPEGTVHRLHDFAHQIDLVRARTGAIMGTINLDPADPAYSTPEDYPSGPPIPYLTMALQVYGPIINRQRLFFLTFAVPLAGLGFITYAVSLEASYVRDRKKWGILKARGMTPRHMASWFLGRSLTVGFLAGILGLGIALAVANIAILRWGRFLENPPPVPAPSSATLWTVVPLGIALALLGGIYAYRRVRRITVADLLRPPARLPTTVGTEGVPWWADASLVTMGVSLLMFPLVATGPTFVGSDILLALWPFGPLLVAFGAARLVLVHRPKVLVAMTRLPKLATRPLVPLVQRDLERHHTRLAGVAVVLAFAVASSATALAVASVEAIAVEREARFAAGADLIVGVTAPNLTWLVGARVPGMRSYAVAAPINAKLASLPYASVDVFAVDFAAYRAIAFSAADAFLAGSPEALESMAGRAIATDRLAADAGLATGATFAISVLDEPTVQRGQSPQYRDFTLSLAGVVVGLPGLPEGGELGALFVDWSTVVLPTFVDEWSNETGCCLHSYILFVSLEPNASAEAVGQSIAALAAVAYKQAVGKDAIVPPPRIQVGESVTNEVLNDPFRAGMLALLDLQAGLATAAGAGYVGMIVHQYLGERSVVLARMRARGGSRRDLVAIILAELTTVAVVATAIGALLGLLSASAVVRVLELRERFLLPRPPIELSWPFVLVVLLPSLLALAAAALVTFYVISRQLGPRMRAAEV